VTVVGPGPRRMVVGPGNVSPRPNAVVRFGFDVELHEDEDDAGEGRVGEQEKERK